MTTEQEVLLRLDILRDFADKKYGPVDSIYETMGALEQELFEVREAIQERDTEKIIAEMLDAANVLIRGAVALTKETGDEYPIGYEEEDGDR